MKRKKSFNKKGLLLAEKTLNIIIALICIVFLASLLFSIYIAIKRKNKNLEFAKESLEYLVDEINSGKARVEIFNPSGDWFLASFSQESQEALPNSCYRKLWESCLCICKEETITAVGGRREMHEQCDKIGTCLENEFVVEPERGGLNAILIGVPPLVLRIGYENKTIKKLEWEGG